MGLLVLLVIGATYSLTRAITTDSFPPSKAIRRWVRNRWGKGSAPDELVRCPWCMSTWVGAVVVLATDRLVDGGLVAPVLVWLAARIVCGLMALNVDVGLDEDED